MLRFTLSVSYSARLWHQSRGVLRAESPKWDVMPDTFIFCCCHSVKELLFFKKRKKSKSRCQRQVDGDVLWPHLSHCFSWSQLYYFLKSIYFGLVFTDTNVAGVCFLDIFWRHFWYCWTKLEKTKMCSLHSLNFHFHCLKDLFSDCTWGRNTEY